MHKLALAIALILVGVAGWIATTTLARSPISAERVDPSEIDRASRNLSVEHPTDFSFVF
jgi:hypothetical protein